MMDKFDAYFYTEECIRILDMWGVAFIGDSILSHEVFTATHRQFIDTMREAYQTIGEDPYTNSPTENADTIAGVIDKLGLDQNV